MSAIMKTSKLVQQFFVFVVLLMTSTLACSAEITWNPKTRGVIITGTGGRVCLNDGVARVAITDGETIATSEEAYPFESAPRPSG